MSRDWKTTSGPWRQKAWAEGIGLFKNGREFIEGVLARRRCLTSRGRAFNEGQDWDNDKKHHMQNPEPGRVSSVQLSPG